MSASFLGRTGRGRALTLPDMLSARTLALVALLAVGCRAEGPGEGPDGERPDGRVLDGAGADGAGADGASADGAGADGAQLDAGPTDGAGLDGAEHDGAVDAGRPVVDRGVEPGVDRGEPAPSPIPPSPAAGPPARYGYAVRAQWPHDTDAFTQGLVFRDGLLYESTGLRGRSSVRVGRLGEVEPRSRHALEARYFGEGLAVVGERLVQLTWQSGVGFVYDRATLAPVGEFRYGGEGWGLTYDGARLIMSDGTSRLRFLDPRTFAEVGGVEVRDAGVAVTRLNELEYIDGEVFANVWLTDRIARIDPLDGRVRGWVDLTGLRPVGAEDVLNGIAWDAVGRRLLVTGKLWPTIFEIALVPIGE